MNSIHVRICDVDGCKGKYYAKGFCKKHYSRHWRNGTLIPKTRYGDDEARFWSYVDKNGPTMSHMDTPCWVWTGYKDRNDYGMLSVRSKLRSSHRYSYELHNGPIPEGHGYHGTCVLHKCDNPPCVNPNHLFFGTQLENMQDKVTKRRQIKGEATPNSVLTDTKVLKIRQLYATGCQTGRQLADKFNVTESNVSSIVNRKSWKHI